jgi:hypothetical protein
MTTSIKVTQPMRAGILGSFKSLHINRVIMMTARLRNQLTSRARKFFYRERIHFEAAFTTENKKQRVFAGADFNRTGYL